MKRSMRNVFAVAGVATVMTLVAPPVYAQVGDAAGCTTDYVDAMNGPWGIPNPVNVTYTPPATVNVDASPGINFAGAFASYAVNATLAYVICVA